MRLQGQGLRAVSVSLTEWAKSSLEGLLGMKRIALLAVVLSWVLAAALAGCKSPAAGPAPAAGNFNPGPLNAASLNLIFVVSGDLSYQSYGDVNPNTANLTSQGLQRSLLMATFLRQQILGGRNVTLIATLEPLTHLQTANNYPDMAAPETIEQFALLNQVTLSTIYPGYGSPYTAYSYPLNASFAPAGASPSQYCTSCQGLDFSDQGGDNESLINHIFEAKMPGFYVFSAPWETTSALMANIARMKGYNLALPQSYQGANAIYVISIAQSGSASLVTYYTNMYPARSYPALPSRVPTSATCTQQAPFSITVTGGRNGAAIPAGTNTNETFYMIRHGEAHPQGSWDDGNNVGAGQWRALDLPYALEGKIHPTLVYSMDPAQPVTGSQSAGGNSAWSYVRPSMTVEPYAIAYNLPFGLASGFDWTSGPATSSFFFNGGKFSNQTVLLGWEHNMIATTVNALIASYFPQGGAPTAPGWPPNDYDTIWTVMLDGQGNLTVNNWMCEGIQSTALPATPPQF